MRAAAARTQGDPSTPSSMFGGHVMSTWSRRPGTPRPLMQLSNVELRQMGQAHQMGRCAARRCLTCV